MSGKGLPVLVLGATSGMARYAALQFAKKGHPVILAGRDIVELERIASDIQIRTGVTTDVVMFEATDLDSHAEFFQNVLRRAKEIHGILLCFGYMAEQTEAEKDFNLVQSMVDINYVGAMSILETIAPYFEERKDGFISIVTSVAGDRGRAANYLYGSTKAGLAAYASGLRARLGKSGVRVVTVKPGFVDTALTFGKDKLPFLASAPDAGRMIANRSLKGGEIAYVPGIWRMIMSVIGLLPEFVFKRTKF